MYWALQCWGHGCELGDATQCVHLGRLHELGWYERIETKKDMTAAGSAYKAACALDSSLCDKIAGFMMDGLAGPLKDSTWATVIDYYKAACKAKNRKACETMKTAKKAWKIAKKAEKAK